MTTVTGYGTAAERYRRRHGGSGSPNRYQDREKEKKSGNKSLIRLCICLGLLAVMMVLKAAAPEMIADATEAILPIIEQDVDYKGAVTAIGEAFSGEADIREVLGEVYLKAFGMKLGNELETSADAGDDALLPVDAFVAAQMAEGEESLLEAIGQGEETQTQETGTTGETPVAVEAGTAVAEADTASDDAAVQAFLESQAAYSDYALPTNVSYDNPNLGIVYQAPSTAATSSGFGYREHPIQSGVLFHYGLDFAANTGDPITAFADGIVTAVGESTTAGIYIRIQHTNGVVTQYDHCSATIASEGERVSMGQIIAQVGATGNATGPHLHFELIVNGKYVNPEYYLTF